MTIQELQAEAFEVNKAHGFGGPAVSTDRQLLLIVGELTEAQNELRKGQTEIYTYYGDNGKPEGFRYELADVVLRILNLASEFNIDLESAIREKHDYNKTRPYRHGGKSF